MVEWETRIPWHLVTIFQTTSSFCWTKLWTKREISQMPRGTVLLTHIRPSIMWFRRCCTLISSLCSVSIWVRAKFSAAAIQVKLSLFLALSILLRCRRLVAEGAAYSIFAASNCVLLYPTCTPGASPCGPRCKLGGLFTQFQPFFFWASTRQRFNLLLEYSRLLPPNPSKGLFTVFFRCSLFLWDRETNELVAKVFDGEIPCSSENQVCASKDVCSLLATLVPDDSYEQLPWIVPWIVPALWFV